MPGNGGGSDQELLLRVEHLSVAYRGTVEPALVDISLSVPAGEVVAVIGPPGAGKTTLLRAVSGLLDRHGGRVTTGDVRVDGRSLEGLAVAARVRLGVSQVLEGRRLFRDLTVEENLRAGAFTVRDRAEVRRRMGRVVDRFPALAPRRNTQAGFLSGGEQQMLAIARALMAQPRVLLLDEPSLGLASAAVGSLAAVVVDLARTGTAVVLVEATTGLASAAGARVVALEGGRLRTPASGPPAVSAAFPS